jgi:hypothetical protein
MCLWIFKILKFSLYREWTQVPLDFQIFEVQFVLSGFVCLWIFKYSKFYVCITKQAIYFSDFF